MKDVLWVDDWVGNEIYEQELPNEKANIDRSVQTQQINGLVHLDKSNVNVRIHCTVSRESGILKEEELKQKQQQAMKGQMG